MTMAVSEANGKPIPAAPNPQPAPMRLETPSAPLSIISGERTPRSRPVRVRRDPGTLSHVPRSTHRHHGTPTPSHGSYKSNHHRNTSFDKQRKSAQQQQFTIDHRRCHIPHQHQTQGRHHPPHLPYTTPARLDQRTNKSQEITENIIVSGTYFKNNQLQQVTTTETSDGFTPIVCSSPNYPQSTLTPHSYYSNTSTPNTTQQPTTKDHSDFFTSHDTTSHQPNRSIDRVHRKGDPPHNHHRSNRTPTNKSHDNLLPTPPHPTTSTLIPAHWSNNIPAPNSLATPILNRSRIVRVRRKDDTAQPRNPKQLSTPASIAAPSVSSRGIDWQGHRKDRLMHHLNSKTASTNSISSASTTASTRHINDDAKTLTPQQNLPTGITPMESSSTIICHQHVNKATQQQPDSEDIPTGVKSTCKNSAPSFSKPQTDNDLQLYPTPYSRTYRYKNFRNTHDTTPAQPGSIWHHRIRYQYYRYQLQNTHLQRRPTEHLRSHPLRHNEAVGTSTTPTTSTATHMTQRYTIDTTTAPLPVLPWYQNLPLTVYSYFYDDGRPGPPWPPPTHNNKLLRVLSMSDTKDPLSTRPGFPQNPTDIRSSRTIHNKQLHPTDPTQADRTQLQADKIRAKLHTHDIRQHFIRNIGPQPSTSDKNLLRPP